MRTSPFRSAIYSHCCKTEKFEAILFYITTTTVACARLIAAHLCRRRQWLTPNVPSRGVDRTCNLLAQRHTPLIAQPSRRRTATACGPPHVPLRGVGGGGTAIVSVEQDGV
jgi:hypothetical protein